MVTLTNKSLRANVYQALAVTIHDSAILTIIEAINYFKTLNNTSTDYTSRSTMLSTRYFPMMLLLIFISLSAAMFRSLSIVNIIAKKKNPRF